jgi:predicted metal-dependent HD superfamily phosphohydrolase
LVGHLNIDKAEADMIAYTLWARMSNVNLHYHTPVHILAIFQKFQELAEIYPELMAYYLRPDVHLAIWFHDAVYNVGAKQFQNESDSAAFMWHMIPEQRYPGSGYSLLDEAFTLVLNTGDFNNLDMDDVSNVVMDLDIMGFGYPSEDYYTINHVLLKKEFLSKMSEEDYNRGRDAFMETVRKRPYVYRTPIIRGLYEYQAQLNINSEI